MTGVGEKQKTGTEPTVAKSEFRIRKEVFCAASLWTRAISSYWTPNYEEGQASQGLAPNHDALNQVWFDDSCVSVPQLSFWFALYTLKQLIVMPGFLAKDLKTRGYSCPPHWRKNVADFDREIKEAVGTKNAADGISHDDVGQVIGPPGDAEWWKSVSANLKGESIPEWKTNAECFRGKFTEKINELRDAMKLSPLKSEELLHSSILKGPDAVWQLRAAALQGVRTDVFASTARSPYYAIDIGRDEMGWLKEPDSLGGQQFKFVIVGTDDKRRLNLNDVSEFLFGHAGHQLIVNCHATGMRGGLSALATELFQPKYREQHGCDLPMLYIPLHGRGLDTPDDNLDGLTMRVHSFYAERLADKEPARGLLCASDSSRQAELICQIRKLMAQYPAIIVFDGYRSPQRTAVADNYPLNTLRAAIADDQLFDLIEQLVMIPTPQITPDGSGIIDVGRFKQNRFLITSDFPLFCDDEREDGRMVPLHPHPLLNFVNGKSFNIAMPASASIPDILPSFGNQAPSQIRLIREQIGGEDHVDMEQLRLAFDVHCKDLINTAQDWVKRTPRSESIYGILSVLIKLGFAGPYPEGLDSLTEDLILRQLINDSLLPHLKTHAGEFRTMLHLVAVAPGGLRPKTIIRAYEHYLHAAMPIEERPRRAEVKCKVAAMLEACNGIVGLFRSDALEAVKDSALPPLYRERFSIGEAEIACDRAIMFAFDEIREALIVDACGEPIGQNGQYVAFLHFILAEEAFDQCVHVGRYDEFQIDDRLSRNNRLFAALYHGAASLHDQTLSLPLGHKVTGRFLPKDPKDRWITLYAFAFRKMLDRPPLHALIRHHDAANMKLDILLLLSHPELWRQPIPAGDIWDWPNLPIESKAAQDFRGDLLKAWSKVLIKLPRTTLPDGNGDFDFRSSFEHQILRIPMDGDIPPLGQQIITHVETRIAGGGDCQSAIDRLSAELVQFITTGSHKRGVMRIAREWAELAASRIQLASTGDADIGKRMKLLCDFLNLFGEASGIAADRLRGGASANARPRELDGFARSFAAYLMAEQLRLRIFRHDPTGTRDTVSGGSGRGFIRVCLRLDNLFRDWRESQGHLNPENSWFWHQARSMADNLARYLSAFPRERAGMLILDAALARNYAPQAPEDGSKGDYIEWACESLEKCEMILLRLSRHSRLRQRFALERCKVMAAAAQHYLNENRELANRYFAIASADLESIDRLRHGNNRLWKIIVEAQRKRLDRLNEQIGAVSLTATCL